MSLHRRWLKLARLRACFGDLARIRSLGTKLDNKPLRVRKLRRREIDSCSRSSTIRVTPRCAFLRCESASESIAHRDGFLSHHRPALTSKNSRGDFQRWSDLYLNSAETSTATSSLAGGPKADGGNFAGLRAASGLRQTNHRRDR
jgi:hypothetical protein